MNKVEDIRVHLKASYSPANVKVNVTDNSTTRLTAENVRQVYENDYKMLRNIPTINGVPVIGDKTLSDYRSNVISTNTTEAWRMNPTYIPSNGEIVIYTDKETIETEDEVIPVPGIKIGDGKAYVADLPFISSGVEELRMHEADNERHITEEERTRWNNKLNYILNEEELVFNRL